jgi:hypothetical protein
VDVGFVVVSGTRALVGTEGRGAGDVVVGSKVVGERVVDSACGCSVVKVIGEGVVRVAPETGAFPLSLLSCGG